MTPTRASAKPAADQAAPAERDQLGLDFSTPQHEERAKAASARALDSSLPSAAERWRAPRPGEALFKGSDALAMACAAHDASLARSLMDLGERWDFNAPFDPQTGRKPGHPTPLAHLLSYNSGPRYGVQSDPGLDERTLVALAMVERGADFLIESSDGLTPLALCAQSRRQEFFEALPGHTDFAFERLRDARAGRRAEKRPKFDEEGEPLPDDGVAEPDARQSLLGYLVLTGQTRAVKALVEGAGFPANGLDVHGRFPIGYCRDMDSLDAMLALGADPALVDSHGRNAFARAQEVDNTATRDAMISRIATEFKKGAKSNPELMAALQRDNIPGLMEAARNKPKSSMLKTISSFKFDVSKTREPGTLRTPLMAAFEGGRLASAEHLIQAG